MSEPKEPGDTAKGLAEQFVGALGLLDLISGGITLYWLRLVLGPGAVAAFPSTGLDFVDVALLACAASMVGKVVSLAAYVLMAVGERRIARSRYRTVVEEALGHYCRATGRRQPAAAADVVELGAECVAVAAPSRHASLERIHGVVMFAYSAALLAIAYAYYLRGRADALGAWWWALAVGAVAVAYLGFVYQRHYYLALGAMLAALVPGRDGVTTPRDSRAG